MRQHYPTDLTDRQWGKIKPLIEERTHHRGRPAIHDKREIVDAIFYILQTGCAWRLLPHDFPSWHTVYQHFREWQNLGTWEKINGELVKEYRKKNGKTEDPSGGIIDSQTVRTTEKGVLGGYDGAKKIKGRKRHILVDTQGLLLQAKITGANISDKEGAIRLLKESREKHLKRIWGDSGYQGQDLHHIFSSEGIDLEIVKRPSGRRRIYNEQWKAEWIPIERVFSVLPRRWVVERTYAWMGRNRRLSKDYEYLPETSETYLYISMCKLLLKRGAW